MLRDRSFPNVTNQPPIKSFLKERCYNQ